MKASILIALLLAGCSGMGVYINPDEPKLIKAVAACGRKISTEAAGAQVSSGRTVAQLTRDICGVSDRDWRSKRPLIVNNWIVIE